VRTERFARFHQQRHDLRTRYQQLTRAVVGDLPAPGADVLHPDPDDEIVFLLTETLPNLRADGLGVPDQPQRTADLGLHVLGWRGDWAALRAASSAATEEVSDPRPATACP
jgi:hypothetical protein